MTDQQTPADRRGPREPDDHQGKEACIAMSGKSPRNANTKKEPKLSLKEKREAKRSKAATEPARPRKSR
ncbi:hypothetical protein GCM10009532_14400 [Microbacterium aurantiacum]